MRKTIVFILSLVMSIVSVSAQSQNTEADEQMTELIMQGDVFGVRNMYELKGGELAPMTRLWAEATIGAFFNDNDLCVDSTNKLLEDHMESLEPVALYSLLRRAVICLEVSSRFEEEERMAQKAAEIFGKVDGIPDTVVPQFESFASYARSLKNEKAMTFEMNGPRTMVPFHVENIGGAGSVCVKIAGQLNGVGADFLFDTGSSTNCIDRSLVHKYNLKMTDASIRMAAGRQVRASIAIAETLTIGNLVYHNVMFSVVDMATGNDEVDKALLENGLILGLNSILPMGAVEIDFERGAISGVPTPRRGSSPNMVRDLETRLFNVLVYHDGEPLAMLFDTGNTDWPILGPDYFRAHRKDVSEEGTLMTRRSAGASGWANLEFFKLVNYSMTVMDYNLVIPEVSVTVREPQNGYLITGSNLGVKVLQHIGKVLLDPKACVLSVAE